VWWTLTEEIAPHAKEMASEKKRWHAVRLACIQGYMGSRNWGSAGV